MRLWTILVNRKKNKTFSSFYVIVVKKLSIYPSKMWVKQLIGKYYNAN